VGLALAEGVLTIGIPLSQTIFLPDFIAVYFLFRQTITWPIRFGLRLGCSMAKAENPNVENIMAKPPVKIPRRLIEFIEKD
jgi:hypothetical protein